MEEVRFGFVEKPVFVREDERGVFEEVINFGTWESLIYGKMKKNAVMGNHYHAYTILFLYLLEGSAQIITIEVNTKERREKVIRAGQGIVFRPSEARAIKYLEDSQFVIMKSKKYDPDNPDLIPYEVLSEDE